MCKLTATGVGGGRFSFTGEVVWKQALATPLTLISSITTGREGIVKPNSRLYLLIVRHIGGKSCRTCNKIHEIYIKRYNRLRKVNNLTFSKYSLITQLYDSIRLYYTVGLLKTILFLL